MLEKLHNKKAELKADVVKFDPAKKMALDFKAFLER